MKKVVLLFMVIVLSCVSIALADRGSIPFDPEVKIFEPNQHAIIAWDGEEEVLILSTELKASAATKAMEVLPLPAEPIVKEADIKIFNRAIRLINSKSPRLVYRTGRAKGEVAAQGDIPPPAGEITFHEKIGAHDISIVHLLSKNGFIEWVENYLKDAGVSNPTIPETIKTSIGEYVEDKFTWFVFDVLSLDETQKTRSAIQYKFKSDSVFYPLKISRAQEGATDIELIVLTPELLDNFPAAQAKLLHRPVSVNREELSEFNDDISGLLGSRANSKLRIWKISGRLASLDKDLIANKSPLPSANRETMSRDINLVTGKPLVLEDYKTKLELLKAETVTALVEITFSERDQYSGGVNKSKLDYTLNILTPITLYRNSRTCAEHASCPGQQVNQVIPLHNYKTYYKCRSRYDEQCIGDGSFDCYYDEGCDYAPYWFKIGERKMLPSLLSITLVNIDKDKVTLRIDNRALAIAERDRREQISK